MSAPPVAPLSAWSLKFLSVEAWSGIVLLLAAAVALGLANSPLGHAWHALWEQPLRLVPAALAPAQTLHFWVDDGLMTVFFLVVGLEIRREMSEGALRDLRVAALPFFAAVGGVVAPALIYIAINPTPATHHGWAVPTATDIAFAVGVLALNPRIPSTLRMLLLTLAIIDDIAAIAVIACFYSEGITAGGVAVAAAGVGLVLAMQRLGVTRPLPYVLPGAIVWTGALQAGIHPALAGVALGLLTPTGGTPAGGTPPLEGLEAKLHPWVAFGVMPLFALANAGIELAGLQLGGAKLAVSAGIVAGLLVGKPLGIVLAARGAVALRLCALPAGVSWHDVLIIGVLGGIGFTMSIFIANLAFDDPGLLTAAKAGVLAASILAGALGILLARQRVASA